ncbi:TetR/AcrR family transcriptional regulator [Amycolatopsis jiangsuensis]|uniref:AcrR family transcriptional regulator n=1 Tax=Amycolatopsis jiangsuensis TaxID=1181879 RepID=A0A840IP84_9PSEU|nr:TetR/AcrR family transcriptional regulator [Amycolatopsis jiangsuensis]MBB4682874.1 AcrR family transcriptional regulator [Amycolatopsis jiangsuensis]
MTTARTRSAAPAGFRQRLLAGLAESIAERGYPDTTVADIVRLARTSRRTFYEHFSGKDTCFVALITETNGEMIRRISAAVDPAAPWWDQVRRAVGAWLDIATGEPAVTVSWIRDVPALGLLSRQLQRDLMENFVTMIQTLTDTEELRAAGVGRASRPVAIVLLGGLRELIATTIEDGGRIDDVRETAVTTALALLGPRG